VIDDDGANLDGLLLLLRALEAEGRTPVVVPRTRLPLAPDDDGTIPDHVAVEHPTWIAWLRWKVPPT
jgi:hypothetical protein